MDESRSQAESEAVACISMVVEVVVGTFTGRGDVGGEGKFRCQDYRQQRQIGGLCQERR